jgi:alkaline phosphatase
MRKLIPILLLFSFAGSFGQNRLYSVANAHSHNDYENKFPFETAYQEHFGSIEADIFLWNDSLIVGHTVNDIKFKRTLQHLYLDPLLHNTQLNHGYPYRDTSLSLQLLIDIKTNAVPTINRLAEIINTYPLLIQSNKIHFVITGNRPNPETFFSYPSFILFDGDLKKEYSVNALSKIALFSDNLTNYTKWNGTGIIPAPEKIIIDSLIQKAHSLNKKVRFWASPDFAEAWHQLIQEDVDYINTDHIVELSSFLGKLNTQ